MRRFMLLVVWLALHVSPAGAETLLATRAVPCASPCEWTVVYGPKQPRTLAEAKMLKWYHVTDREWRRDYRDHHDRMRKWNERAESQCSEDCGGRYLFKRVARPFRRNGVPYTPTEADHAVPECFCVGPGVTDLVGVIQ